MSVRAGANANGLSIVGRWLERRSRRRSANFCAWQAGVLIEPINQTLRPSSHSGASPSLPSQPSHSSLSLSSPPLSPSLSSPIMSSGPARRRPSQSGVEALPATPLPDSLPTSQHNPRWALYSGRPNIWTRFRTQHREVLAEFLGTACILVFGAGVECQG